MRERFGKKAQFFLLAAVIISAIVISLGITANEAKINKEPEHFYDYSYNVKRETGAVVDYEIFTDFGNDADLGKFVDLLAKDIRDEDSDSNFLFIYGDYSQLILKNYGSESVVVGVGGEDDVIPGANYKIKSTVKIRGIDNVYTEIDTPMNEFDGSWNKTFTSDDGIGEGSFVEVKIRDYVFPFNVSKYKQVIFIMQKDEEGESYVSVK
ncbi:MAG: hypothetical protein WC548_00860 [Candidatus Pacearchaeota archaeon]